MTLEIPEPRKIAEDILRLASDYGRLGERFNELNGLYAMWWQTSRPDFKSDKSAEKAWDLTKEGQEMAEVRLKMKTKQIKMSALKAYLRVLSEEAHNQY